MRQEDSGTSWSKDVSRLGIEPGSQELASCAITARPSQNDTTGPRHRTFDVFQGSCYTILLPSARPPVRASKPSSATSVTGFQVDSWAREATGRFRDAKRCVATGDRTRVSGISLLRHNRWTTSARYHRTPSQRFWRVSGFLLQWDCFRFRLSPVQCWNSGSW